jgi:hypothetical protein
MSSNFVSRFHYVYEKIKSVVRQRCNNMLKDDWSGLWNSQKVFTYKVADGLDGIPYDWLFRGCLQEFDMPLGRRNDAPLDLLASLNLISLFDYITTKMGDHFHVKMVVSSSNDWVTIYATVNDSHISKYSSIVPVVIQRKKFAAKRNVEYKQHKRYEPAPKRQRVFDDTGAKSSFDDNTLASVTDFLSKVFSK